MSSILTTAAVAGASAMGGTVAANRIAPPMPIVAAAPESQAGKTMNALLEECGIVIRGLEHGPEGSAPPQP